MPTGPSVMQLHQKRGPTSPINLRIHFTDEQFVFKWKAPSSAVVYLNWGNRMITAAVGQNNTLITSTSNYQAPGVYNFYLTGDYRAITRIEMTGQGMVHGRLSSLDQMKNLDTIAISHSRIKGSVVGLAKNLKLRIVSFYDTLLNGNVDKFAANPNLRVLEIRKSRITFDSQTAWLIRNGVIWLSDNKFKPHHVDNAMTSLSWMRNSKVLIDGNNAHRTILSTSHIARMQSRGNTVLVNDLLGDELATGWNVFGWWDIELDEEVYNETGWIFANGELSAVGDYGVLVKYNFWEIGQTYRVEQSFERTARVAYGPHDDMGPIRDSKMSDSEDGIYHVTPRSTTMRIRSQSYTGRLYSLSIKKVL